jgi:MFS transporter, DHA3 family, macrolide efflux protein
VTETIVAEQPVAGNAGTVAEPAGKPSMLALLRQPNFRTLWLAQTVSWSGDHFTFLALTISINLLTGSATAIALIMVVMTVPRLLFGMAAGVFVDRWDRQRLMVASDLMRGALSLALLWAIAARQIWLIYPLAFVISTVGVFFVPARGAVMKTILQPDELLPANILMQLTFTLTLVIGAALAGVAIGLFGAGPAFAFDALTFFVSATLIAVMSVPRVVSVAQTAGVAGFWHEFREGMSFIAGSRTIAGLLLVLTVVSLATGAINALFVPFLMNILQATAVQLGLVDSAQGIGMIVGSILTAAIAVRLRSNQIIAGGLFLASLTIIAIGLAPTYLVVLILLFFVGLVVMPIEATIPAITQKIVPLDKMGRVGGTMNTSQSFATLLSMGAAGVMADVIGLRAVYVAAGVIGIGAALLAVRAISDS